VDREKDSTKAKFMFHRIKIAQTYHWSDAATAGNFKLLLSGKAIDWLNYIKDTEQMNISLWSRIEPQLNFFLFGPPKESIFLTTFYGLYFSPQLHMLQITILFMI
jgi:hypothetical protein